MQKSESIKQLVSGLITFSAKVDKIKKDAKNPFFKSTYASLHNILDSISIPLAESGLSVCQFPTGVNHLTTILSHESGEWMQADFFMKPVKDDPQGVGSCITYMRRYALSSILCLSIDDDDDANVASGKEVPKTTLYNHKELGTKEKPLIKNAQFKAVCERVQSGELEVYQKSLDTFTFESNQLKMFTEFYNQQKAKS